MPGKNVIYLQKILWISKNWIYVVRKFLEQCAPVIPVRPTKLTGYLFGLFTGASDVDNTNINNLVESETEITCCQDGFKLPKTLLHPECHPIGESYEYFVRKRTLVKYQSQSEVVEVQPFFKFSKLNEFFKYICISKNNCSKIWIIKI